MRLSLFILFLVLSNQAFSATIQGVSVQGTEQAQVVFELEPTLHPLPTSRVDGNLIELTFNDTNLSETLSGKVELKNPHILIRRVSVFPVSGQQIKAHIVITGSTNDLTKRITVERGNKGVQLSILYPEASRSQLAMMQEEQKPFSVPVKEGAPKKASLPWGSLIIVLVVIAGAAVSTFFFFRYLQNKGIQTGSRKFLVEKLSYSAIGPKTGVALIKVGSEFVLVGITPHQVTLLSHLPKLEAQYQSDAKLERDSFEVAVKDEFQKVSRTKPTLKAQTASLETSSDPLRPIRNRYSV